MDLPLINKIVEAVLYEGYMLYPYRPSSKKNRQRFTFGRVYPLAYSVAQKGAEPCLAKTECLVTTDHREAQIEVSARFLHVVSREIFRLPQAMTELPSGLDTDSLDLIPELQVGNQRYSTWQEAAEEQVDLPAQLLDRICDRSCNYPFTVQSSCILNPIKDSNGFIVGLEKYRRETLNGEFKLAAERLDSRTMKITAEIANVTALSESELDRQETVLMRTFASTHTVLHVTGAAFVSLMDPPKALAGWARSCQNQGTWPVLVGNEEAGDNQTMLSSPIILYDYPKIASESPGQLFDGTEIDEILTLRVMTLTEAEREEMRQSDQKARQILERTDSLSEEQFLNLHGTMRELKPSDSDFFGDNRRLEFALKDGVQIRAGDRVRIRPQRRADIMDMALEGKIGVIEAIEEDAENRVHLALVIDDDPGQDFGYMRQPGHRFFYTLDDVELVGTPD